MKIREVKELLNAKVLACEEKLDCNVSSAFASDMMSDTLAFAKDVSILITGLCNPQVMRTADLLDIDCIIFIRGKEPTENMIELAVSNDICVLATNYAMYVASGILYSTNLIGGVDIG